MPVSFLAYMLNNQKKTNKMKLTKEQVLGIIRHGLTFVGGILLTKGLADSETLTEISGAVLTLVGAIWSVVSKRTTTV